MKLGSYRIIMILASLIPAAAFGVNWMYLAKDPGPYMVMSDPDRELLHNTAHQALEQSPDGSSVDWHSPESDAHGEVTPLSTFDRDGMRCRKVRFDSHAKNLSNIAEHTLCKTAAGNWAFAD